jgi:hypothetical protein
MFRHALPLYQVNMIAVINAVCRVLSVFLTWLSQQDVQWIYPSLLTEIRRVEE